MLKNILQYLENTAARMPDKLAFSDGERTLTHGELLQISRRVGSYLSAKAYRREPVMLLLDRSPEAVAATLGVIYSGCYYVVLETDMPLARMGQIMDTMKARVLVCDEKNTKKANELAEKGLFSGEILSWEEAKACSEDSAALEDIRSRQIDTDPIYVVFTSGSTGIPKGVAACHRSVIDYTEALCEVLPFSEDTVFANQTPLYFDAPLKEIMPTLKYGATVYLVPKKLFMFPVKLCEFLNAHRINTVCWVVSALTMISALGALEKTPPQYLTTICFGSEVFPRPQYDLWRAAYPDAAFFNLYGPTEATGMSCYWPVRDLLPDEPIPVGYPFNNTRILLLTDDGKEAADGEVGEIHMQGTCVTLGYYANPEKTAEAFVQNPLNPYYPELIYRTGDLGRYNERGELVFISRRDAQIKHMGHRIELGEIEAAAASVEGVGQCCCVYDNPGKRIALYYVGDVQPKDMQKALREKLPRYMLPAICEVLTAMPRTPNGKLDRKGLRERAEQEE